MKRWIGYFSILMLLALGWACKSNQVEPALPSYLTMPGDLTSYNGSGLITVSGGLSLRAEGAEHLDPATKTYSGVNASVLGGNLLAQFTAGQPLAYQNNSTVPVEYRSNGALRINSSLATGTYPMGINSQAGPHGERADLTLNLPGPQIYFTQDGSLMITEAARLKQQGTLSLYRLTGTFSITLGASGVGTLPGKPTLATGTFDILTVTNL